MPYAIYLRKSRADEEAEARGEGETLARHRTALLDLARRLSLSVVEIYEEIASGDTISGRPAMRRLLADVAARRFDGVLCMQVDRLGRGDSMDQGYIMQTFLYSGTCIITPEKTYDPANPVDFEFFEMRQFFARREYTSVKGRLQAGRELASKEGYFIGSRAPYGYTIVPSPDKRSFTLAVVPEQAQVVRQIYEWYLNGSDTLQIRDKMGCGTIAQLLNSANIPNSLGNPWIESTVCRLIKNPVYIGHVTWNKRKQRIDMQDGQRVKRRPLNPDHIDVVGKHEPIVDESVWLAANQAMDTRRTSHTVKSKQTAFVFSSILKCAVCGKAMIRQPNVHNPAYDIIKCSTPKCPNHGAYIATLERLVLSELEAWLTAVPDEKQPRQSSSEALREQLEKQLATLSAQQSRLHDLLEQGVYDIPTFLQRQRSLADKEADLQARLSALQQPPRLTPAQAIARIAPQIESVLESYGYAESAAEKNALLKSVIHRIVYDRPRRRYKNEPEYTAISITIYPVGL